MSFSLLGIGSPLLDIQLKVDDAVLIRHVPGSKGGMEPVTKEEIREMISKAPGSPVFSPGGAAGNTVFALSAFGVEAALFGKLGIDSFAEKYLSFADNCGVDTSQIIRQENGDTGCCLAMITDDAERTMRSSLGVSLDLSCREIENAAFDDYDAVLVEGFMVFSGKLEKMISEAHSRGCFVILDLASFEIASGYRELFLSVSDKVSMVVANEAEAAAFTGKDEPEQSLKELRKIFPAAVVKCGSNGVWFSDKEECFFTPAVPACAVDTTAAGDIWLAGFIYARNCGANNAVAVRCGTLFASKIIAHTGSVLNSDDIKSLKELTNFKTDLEN